MTAPTPACDAPRDACVKTWRATLCATCGGWHLFSAMLRARRLELGISVGDMAKRLECSRQQVHRIETSQNLREQTIKRYLLAAEG